MIEPVRKERHKHIRTGQTADVLDELADEHDNHVGGHHPADGTPDGIQHKPPHRYIAFAELLGERPYRKDTDAHGHPADDGNEHLRGAVVIRAQDIVAIIHKAHVLERGTDGGNQEIAKENEKVLVRQDDFDLH